MSANRGAASFGSTLRDARERRGLSLRQIASATKISMAVLEALERDDISRLPGGIFSRAFVRAYAAEVGLDPEAAIEEFIAQFPNDAAVTAGHPASGGVEDHAAVESERRTAGTFLWLAVISVPVAIALIYFAAAGRQRTNASATSDGADSGTVALPPSGDRPPVSPATADGSQPAAAPSPPAGLPPAAAAEKVEPAPPSAGAAPPPAEAPSPAAAPADHLAIDLSVRRPCWISVTVDGRKSIERLLQPGEHQTIDVRRELALTAGDAAAVVLTFNGAEGRPLGKAGEVVTARFNLTNFKSYLQAR
jgi:cytoskeleton protein RodZ